MNDKFETANFYSLDEYAETLWCESPKDALDGYGGQFPVTVYAWARMKVSLPHDLESGKRLSEHIMELLDNGDEEGFNNFGPGGDHQPLDCDEISEIERLAQNLVDFIKAKAVPYGCEVVAEREYSEDEVMAMFDEGKAEA